MSERSKLAVLTVCLIATLTACSVSQSTYTPLADGGAGPGPGADIDGGDPAPGPTQLTVTVTGLAGEGLTVANGGDDLQLPGNGTFPFTTPVPHGASYDVEIKTQPTRPSQVCAVITGAGTADQDTGKEIAD